MLGAAGQRPDDSADGAGRLQEHFAASHVWDWAIYICAHREKVGTKLQVRAKINQHTHSWGTVTVFLIIVTDPE